MRGCLNLSKNVFFCLEEKITFGFLGFSWKIFYLFWQRKGYSCCTIQSGCLVRKCYLNNLSKLEKNIDEIIKLYLHFISTLYKRCKKNKKNYNTLMSSDVVWFVKLCTHATYASILLTNNILLRRRLISFFKPQ